jgi:tubby-related protein 1
LIDDDLPYHKTEAADNGLLAIVDKSGPDFSRLQTRKPIWSDDLEAWTMDFHGRVKLASKKNFLLVSENAPNEVLMLFGKVSKSHFSLDFKAPMTVMQAFCIALTSFADKMLVT